MSMLTREAILAADDLKTETVAVPEWGGDVLVRMMTGAQRDAFSASLVSADGKPQMDNFRPKLVAWSVVDESGNLMFTADDIQALAVKSAAALDRVAAVAQRLNKMGPESVEEAAKN